MMNLTHMKLAYYSQKGSARKRGIEFKLTYKEWLEIWGDKIDQRGRGKGKFCMARKNDQGPYEVGNVYIQLFEKNNKDQHKWNNRKDKKIGNSECILYYKQKKYKFNNLSQASRYFGFKYATFWKNLKDKKEFRGITL